MTIWTILIAVAAIPLIALIYYLPRFIQMHRELRERASKQQDEFFDAATHLLRAEDTTVRLRGFVLFMSRNLDNTKLPRRIFADALSGRLEKISAEPSPKARALLGDIGQLSENTEKQLYRAITAFIFSLIYSDVFCGWFLRRTIFFSAKRDKQTAAVVVGETAIFDDGFLPDPQGGTAAIAA